MEKQKKKVYKSRNRDTYNNILHKLYYELGGTRKEEFRAYLVTYDIPYTTFRHDTHKQLHDIYMYRYGVYADFFGAENLPNISEIKDDYFTKKLSTQPLTEEV